MNEKNFTNGNLYIEFNKLVKKEKQNLDKKGIKIQILYGNNGAGKTTLFNNLVNNLPEFYTSFNKIFNSIENSKISQIINENLVIERKKIIEELNKKIKEFILTEEEINKLINSFKKNLKEYIGEDWNETFKYNSVNKDNLFFSNKKVISFEYLDNLSKSYKLINKWNKWKEQREFKYNINYKNEADNFISKCLDLNKNFNSNNSDCFDKASIDKMYILLLQCLEQMQKKINWINEEKKKHNDYIVSKNNINYNKVGESNLNILNEIIKLVLVNNNIYFKLKKDINELNIVINNKIKSFNDIRFSDFDFLSSGEKTLLKLMISFIFLATFNSNENKKYFLVDDCDEVFDGLVRIYCLFLFKLFSERYNINFIIFTHNSLLANEMREIVGTVSKSNKEKKIKVYFLKKGDTLKKLKSATVKEYKFLSLSDSVHFIKEKFWEIFEKEKLKIVLYVLWIIRVLKLVKERYKEDPVINILNHDFYSNPKNEDIKKINSKKIISEILNFLKIKDLIEQKKKELKIELEKENSDEKIKKLKLIIEKYQEKTKNIEEYFSYNKRKKVDSLFWDEINKIDDKFLKSKEEYFNEINKLNNFYDDANDWKINILNIKNILHVIFLRRNLRKWIDIKYQEIESEEETKGQYKHKVEILESRGKINKEQTNKIIFLLITIDNFFHAENSPNISVKGIELDSDYLVKIINIFYDTIGWIKE